MMKFKVISFYVIKPFDIKEKVMYFFSKVLDHLSVTNHPLLARVLKLKNYIIIPNMPLEYHLETIMRSTVQHQEINMHRKKPFILFVGRLASEKNPELALFLFCKLLRKLGLNLRLLIVGDGPLRPRLERLSMKLGIEKYVEFVGFKPPDEVMRLMRHSLALIHTSTYEYFPNVLIEALIMRTLTIVPKIPQYEWVIDPTLIDIKNPDKSLENVCRILKDEKLYRKCLRRQLKRLLFIYLLYQRGLNNLREMLTTLLHSTEIKS